MIYANAIRSINMQQFMTSEWIIRSYTKLKDILVRTLRISHFVLIAIEQKISSDIWDKRQQKPKAPCESHPDSKVHGANMGPNWVLSAPDGPHVGPINLVNRADHEHCIQYAVSVAKCTDIKEKHLTFHDGITTILMIASYLLLHQTKNIFEFIIHNHACFEITLQPVDIAWQE